MTVWVALAIALFDLLALVFAAVMILKVARQFSSMLKPKIVPFTKAAEQYREKLKADAG